MKKYNNLTLRYFSHNIDSQHYDFNFYIDDKVLDTMLGFNK